MMGLATRFIGGDKGRRGNGQPDLLPTQENIDPVILPLVEAINGTGMARTRASCQGHWGICEAYVAFNADLGFAKQFDAWLKNAYSARDLKSYWELPASFGLDGTLWFRLAPATGSRPSLCGFRWPLGSLKHDIDQITQFVLTCSYAGRPSQGDGRYSLHATQPAT